MKALLLALVLCAIPVHAADDVAAQIPNMQLHALMDQKQKDAAKIAELLDLIGKLNAVNEKLDRSADICRATWGGHNLY
jgi:hypothetical protein